jgi:adenylate kinase family enzyme
MNIPSRIHITGAAGAGVSTLGRAVAEWLGVSCHDADDFFWLPDDPPYQAKRDPMERQTLLARVLDDRLGWVVAGSLDGWGDALVRTANLVVYLDTATEIRLARIRRREAVRFGARILPGGDMAEQHQDFLDYAASYEIFPGTRRSRSFHEQWLAGLPRPVLRLDGLSPVDDNIAAIISFLTGC